VRRTGAVDGLGLVNGDTSTSSNVALTRAWGFVASAVLTSPTGAGSGRVIIAPLGG